MILLVLISNHYDSIWCILQKRPLAWPPHCQKSFCQTLEREFRLWCVVFNEVLTGYTEAICIVATEYRHYSCRVAVLGSSSSTYSS